LHHNHGKGARNLFRISSQLGLINEKRFALKNRRAWKLDKFRALESSRAASPENSHAD
jgi:hypothetical protein